MMAGIDADYASLRTFLDACAVSVEKAALRALFAWPHASEKDKSGLMSSLAKEIEQFRTTASVIVAAKEICTCLKKSVAVLSRDFGTIVSNFSASADKQIICTKITEICAHVSQLPTSNRAAVKRQVLSSEALIRDTVKEFDALVEAECVNDGGEVVGDDDWEDDFGGLDDTLDEEERLRTKTATALMLATCTYLREGASFPKDAPASALDSFVDSCARVSELSTELGVTLYPPQDGQEVADAASKLVEAAISNHTEGRDSAAAGKMQELLHALRSHCD